MPYPLHCAVNINKHKPLPPRHPTVKPRENPGVDGMHGIKYQYSASHFKDARVPLCSSTPVSDDYLT